MIASVLGSDFELITEAIRFNSLLKRGLIYFYVITGFILYYNTLNAL